MVSCATGTSQRIGIVMPVYPPHFVNAQDFLVSFCALVVDPAAVPVGFIMSNRSDELAFRAAVAQTLALAAQHLERPCPLNWATANWQAIQYDRDGRSGSLEAECGRNRFNVQSGANTAWAFAKFNRREEQLFTTS